MRPSPCSAQLLNSFSLFISVYFTRFSASLLFPLLLLLLSLYFLIKRRPLALAYIKKCPAECHAPPSRPTPHCLWHIFTELLDCIRYFGYSQWKVSNFWFRSIFVCHLLSLMSWLDKLVSKHTHAHTHLSHTSCKDLKPNWIQFPPLPFVVFLASNLTGYSASGYIHIARAHSHTQIQESSTNSF